MTDETPLHLREVDLIATALPTGHPRFSLRRYRPVARPRRTLIVFDDELIGDAAIAACRLRTIDGSLADTELLLVGFGENRFAELHQRRGAGLTFFAHDLSIVGIEQTGTGRELAEFIRDEVQSLCAGEIGLLGYSLSGLFAIDLAREMAGSCSYLALLSPSLWLDVAVQDRLLDHMGKCHQLRVFLRVGGKEEQPIPGDRLTMCERVSAFGELLRSRYGERVEVRALADADHTSVILHAVDRALLSFQQDLPAQGL